MHAAYKRCDNADVVTLDKDQKMISLTHFGFPLAVLGNKKLIRPTNQVFHTSLCLHLIQLASSLLTYFVLPD